MRLRLTIASVLTAALLPCLAAVAQDAPRPEVLVRSWAASFSERAADVSRVELRERSGWVLDGPFGVRRTLLVADVTGGPDVEGWRRDLVRVEVDGRRVALRRWREIDNRRRALMGLYTEKATQEIVQLAPTLEKLRPADQTRTETLDGVATWRVELIPIDPGEALQRYTLWFDRRQGHLLRSRAVALTKRSDVPFFITTFYSRVEGFDVPTRRLIEGTTTTQRRRRTYTLLFSFDAEYDRYRFIRR